MNNLKFHLALIFITASLLSACATPASGSLSGTSWILQSINGSQVGAPVNGQSISLNFTSASEMSGFGGCNSYSGSYQSNSASLTFSNIVSTLMACVDNNLSRVETEFFNALSAASAYTLTQCESCTSADSLTISGGGNTLVFVKN
jgi:heat shock protein HslJ